MPFSLRTPHGREHVLPTRRGSWICAGRAFGEHGVYYLGPNGGFFPSSAKKPVKTRDDIKN
jgi:hypothetical protein